MDHSFIFEYFQVASRYLAARFFAVIGRLPVLGPVSLVSLKQWF